ncbi:NAD(P)-dependent alcohol dehydrogenase, partial [Pseudomonas sp. RTI1]|nr:NAD(P)-dependent alcohol dehydrogenase [Pseudomonas sp. RTI1]
AAAFVCGFLMTFSPMNLFGVKTGDKVVVLGIGGVGDLGFMLYIGMGAVVTLFSSSDAKSEEGRRLGSDEVFVYTIEGQMKDA